MVVSTDQALIIGILGNRVLVLHSRPSYRIGELYYAEDSNYYYIFRVIELTTLNPSIVSKYISSLPKFASSFKDFADFNFYLLFGPVMELVATISKSSMSFLKVKLFPRTLKYVYPVSENSHLENFLSPYSLSGLPANVRKSIYSRNILVVGASGAGKSTFTKRIICELARDIAPIPVVIIDFHGEYRSIACNSAEVKFIEPKLREREILPEVFSDVFQISAAQEEFLYYARKYFEQNWLSNTKKLAFQGSGFVSLFHEATISVVRRRIEQLLETGIVASDESQESAVDALLDSKAPRILVIDFSQLDLLAARVFLYALARYLLQNRIPAKIVVDEAHNILLPANQRLASIETGVEKIFREGRKFGISMMLVSQIISSFSPAILNNTDTFVCFRIPNYVERKYLVSTLPRDFEGMELQLQSLNNLVAVVITSFWPIPITLYL
jgi:Cdc6-like AAA superfamily ATPase